MDNFRSRQDEKPPTGKPAAPGIRTPFAGESSSSNVPVPSEDGATRAGPSPKTSDPEATLVDADVTIVPGSSFRRTPVPPTSQISGLHASAAVLEIGNVLGGRYEILQLLGEG